MIEPVGSLEHRQLYCFEVVPRIAFALQLFLEQSYEGLSQRVVVGIGDTAPGRLNPPFCQFLHITNLHVLRQTLEFLEPLPVIAHQGGMDSLVPLSMAHPLA